jgi:peptidoglycan/LPS O-acetylase OafA/YrhL
MQEVADLKNRAKPRRVQLDFVRGVAILMVMLGHFRKPHTGVYVIDKASYLADLYGGRGVDLFFVLSGFLVGGLLLKEYRDTRGVYAGRFLVRRMFKIWPAYYFLLLFHTLAHHHPIGSFLWQNALHLQNYFGSSITQTWTLSIEEHFYLLLAFLLAFAASRRWTPAVILKMCAALSLLALLSRCITAAAGNYSGALTWTQNRIDSLLFGVILATLFYMMPDLYKRLAAQIYPLAAVIALVLVWVLTVRNRFLLEGPGYTLVYAGAGAFLILVNEHSGRLSEWRIYRAVSWIGVYSYGLYLWHSAMLGMGEKIIASYPPKIAWILALVVQFFGSIVIAFVTTRLVEWPFLKWRESINWLRDAKPTALAVSVR